MTGSRQRGRRTWRRTQGNMQRLQGANGTTRETAKVAVNMDEGSRVTIKIIVTVT